MRKIRDKVRGWLHKSNTRKPKLYLKIKSQLRWNYVIFQLQSTLRILQDMFDPVTGQMERREDSQGETCLFHLWTLLGVFQNFYIIMRTGQIMVYGHGSYNDYLSIMIMASFTFSLVTLMRLSLVWSRGENRKVYNEILEAARGKTTNK